MSRLRGAFGLKRQTERAEGRFAAVPLADLQRAAEEAIASLAPTWPEAWPPVRVVVSTFDVDSDGMMVAYVYTVLTGGALISGYDDELLFGMHDACKDAVRAALQTVARREFVCMQGGLCDDTNEGRMYRSGNLGRRRAP